MSMDAARNVSASSPYEQLRYAREILRAESAALAALAERLDTDFCEAARRVLACTGSVLVSGMGKAGLIGQKITATLASTGTRSHFLHPAEAVHGDLGRVHSDDLVLMLSFSGETEEVVRILPWLREAGIGVIAVTGKEDSTLARQSDVVLPLGPMQEACSLGLAPSTSTTAMLALGDALALVASRSRGFAAEDFARFHPGGSLGRKLSYVQDAMRPLSDCRVASATLTIREVLLQHNLPGRRTGAIMLVDEAGVLQGIFTDSDLSRLIARQQDAALDRPIAEVMTASPKTIAEGAKLLDAIEVLDVHKISELPVVTTAGRPLGIIDVTDVIGLLPAAKESGSGRAPSVPGPHAAPPIVPFQSPRAGTRRESFRNET